MKSRLYTRTGDDGTTSLVGGARAPKDCVRLEAYGTVDELNSWLGVVAASPDVSQKRREQLRHIQHRLFNVGAILATEPESAWQPEPLAPAEVEWLERAIDDVDGQLSPMRNFILPGGSQGASFAHVARCVARRAERRVIALGREADIDPQVIVYINRLSDYLFALAREINQESGVADIAWHQDD